MTCRSNVQKRLRDMLFTCCCSGDGAENVARGCVRSTLFALHRETNALPMLNEALFEGRNEYMVNLIDSHKRTGFIIDKDGGGVIDSPTRWQGAAAQVSGSGTVRIGHNKNLSSFGTDWRYPFQTDSKQRLGESRFCEPKFT